MSDTPLHTISAKTIAARVNAGTLSVQDVATHFIHRTETYAKQLNTHLFWDRTDVERQVLDVAARLKSGEQLPLAGVPVVLKDNICVAGRPTTCGSKMLENYRPPYDAHVTERLKAAGALLFGKANCDEFAMGSSNENSAFGAVRNPWDQNRVPGGSSGGSAAAVAAGMAPLALGSDTGGSIRQPASFCGLVGLKPTYGRVSRYGLVAYASSLDQIGPFSKTVEDAALMLDVISGHDPRDATSDARPPTQITDTVVQSLSLKGIRIGLVKEFFGAGLDSGTRAALESAKTTLQALGAEIRELTLPHLSLSIAAYYLVATAEASSNLARFDGVRYGYRHKENGQSLSDMYRKTRSEGLGREVKQRIMLGTFALSSGYYDAYYTRANQARVLIAQDFADAFLECDVLLSPTSPTTAFRIGEKSEDPLAMYLADICTVAANLAGVPAVSLPCGVDELGLPVGMQLMAPRFGEDVLLKTAYAFEQKQRFYDNHNPSL